MGKVRTGGQWKKNEVNFNIHIFLGNFWGIFVLPASCGGFNNVVWTTHPKQVRMGRQASVSVLHENTSTVYVTLACTWAHKLRCIQLHTNGNVHTELVNNSIQNGSNFWRSGNTWTTSNTSTIWSTITISNTTAAKVTEPSFPICG